LQYIPKFMYYPVIIASQFTDKLQSIILALGDHERFFLNLNICPPFLSFVSISSVRSLMWYIPRWGPDKATQLVPFANNFSSLVRLFFLQFTLLHHGFLPARIIITMVEIARQTTHREILGIFDCCENKLRPLTNEKLF